ncbi:TetR/AcrR family transcriptional regulator [Streptomyces sp. CA-250714]|uniref:TetR/AcrR family transcriptional regulator n=1 Tax=Streptomyces sp. CA-250714 TaxID=3240060 RepID=UPI003D92826D
MADRTTEAAAQGLRERKKLETRSALRAAAVRMYLERGPSAVTVQDICEAAGVSQRTFFNYFETKDDAVFDWDRRLAGRLGELLTGRPAGEAPPEALHQALRTAVPALVADPGWRDRRRLLGAHPELVPKLLHSNSSIAEALADAVAERTGLPPDALYPRLLGGIGLTVLRSSIRAWDPESPAEELLATLDSCFASLAAGLPQPEGDDPAHSAC